MVWPRVRRANDGPDAREATDDYLAALPAPQRTALERLRAVIERACPDAVPAVSYDIPAFRYRGRVIAGFAAATRHVALYPFSGEAVERHAEDLRAFDASKGTIRFTPDRPLPDELVERIVRWRMARVDAGGR